MQEHARRISHIGASSAEQVEEARLSARRAFVVQFRKTDGEAPDRFAGRVEHMVSGLGHAAHFHSAHQLTSFMRQILGCLDSKAKEETEQ
jgi:hypothetical protein